MWEMLEAMGYGDPWSEYAWHLVARHEWSQRQRADAPPRHRTYDAAAEHARYQQSKPQRQARSLSRVEIEREHKRKTWAKNRERYNAARRAKAAIERMAVTP